MHPFYRLRVVKVKQIMAMLILTSLYLLHDSLKKYQATLVFVDR